MEDEQASHVSESPTSRGEAQYDNQDFSRKTSDDELSDDGFPRPNKNTRRLLPVSPTTKAKSSFMISDILSEGRSKPEGAPKQYPWITLSSHYASLSGAAGGLMPVGAAASACPFGLIDTDHDYDNEVFSESDCDKDDLDVVNCNNSEVDRHSGTSPPHTPTSAHPSLPRIHPSITPLLNIQIAVLLHHSTSRPLKSNPRSAHPPVHAPSSIQPESI